MPGHAQEKMDSTIQIGKKTITLSEVVVNNKLNVASFINHIKEDTSFYKAFRNLRILGFTAINDIRMNDGKGNMIAGLQSTTQQIRINNCRSMKTLEKKVTGNMYHENGEFTYYTAKMYASLFFTKGMVCGENNIVAGTTFNTAGKRGLEKNKEQLKMLFFNPGKRINGLPLMSDKTAIYDEELADKYTMRIDAVIFKNQSCYSFSQQVKPENKNEVVVDEMTTWFNDQTFEVVGRNYSLSYQAGFYDFKVTMEVEMTKFGNYLVPSLIRYSGNWKVVLKPRETGVFTATLFDFN
jgi:hypothetical protein